MVLRMTEQPGTTKRGGGKKPPGGGGHNTSSPGPLTPRARAKKIAADRLPKAIKAIEHLKQFGNTAVYEFYPGECDQMIAALSRAVDEFAYVMLNPGKAPPVLKFEDEDE